jgi:hypothetical protein
MQRVAGEQLRKVDAAVESARRKLRARGAETKTKLGEIAGGGLEQMEGIGDDHLAQIGAMGTEARATREADLGEAQRRYGSEGESARYAATLAAGYSEEGGPSKASRETDEAWSDGAVTQIGRALDGSGGGDALELALSLPASAQPGAVAGLADATFERFLAALPPERRDELRPLYAAAGDPRRKLELLRQLHHGLGDDLFDRKISAQMERDPQDERALRGHRRNKARLGQWIDREVDEAREDDAGLEDIDALDSELTRARNAAPKWR